MDVGKISSGSSVRSAALAIAGAALAVSIGLPAGATTTTGTFSVRARVVSECTLTTTDLEIPLARDQVVPSIGSTTFTVNCGAVSHGNPMPVQFTFVPSGGAFEMKEQSSSQSVPYQLCNDSACNEVYAAGAAGPVVGVDAAAFSYHLWAKALPLATGVQPGDYAQQVVVTLTY
jgi:spore coat protein U-like protein